MGNSLSSKTQEYANEMQKTAIDKVIDELAAKYILTSDFKSLKELNNLEKCNSLVVIASDAIERTFSSMEITYISNRINGTPKPEKDKFVFFQTDELQKNLTIDPAKKREVCIGIAKFYVKIAHAFAAIVKTINPIYEYDKGGKKMAVPYNDRKNIPANKIETAEIVFANLCGERLASLTKNTADGGIKPDVCSKNRKRNLREEQGIPELEMLYLDAGYNIETGEFTKMSVKMQAEYDANLKDFYKAFTRRPEMDYTIKTFADIKLKQYMDSPECSTTSDNGKYLKSVNPDGSLLFENYAINISDSLRYVNEKQQKLLGILNKLFVFTSNPTTKSRHIRVNPELTEKTLVDIIGETRTHIIELYTNCETHYEKGIQIYEAIVNKQMIATSISQTNALVKTQLELMHNK